MPILRPLPIETKDKSLLKRTGAWLSATRKWEVMEDWHYTYGLYTILIPKGFIFDGASIPKIFRNLLSPTGILLIPGLLHDFGYRYNYLLSFDTTTEIDMIYCSAGQKFFDQLFLDVAKQINGMHRIDKLAYYALRVGGKKAWNEHRKNDIKREEFHEGDIV